MPENQNCPFGSAKIDPQAVQDNIPNILTALGIGKCTQDTTVAADILCGCGVANSLSIGCEQISVISQKYLEATSAVTCIINSTKTKVETSVVSGNDFELVLHDTGTIKCDDGINIKQGTVINFIGANSLTDVTQNQITSTLQSFINETMKSISSSKQGFLGTAQGIKSINDAVNAVTKNIDTIITTKIVNDVFTKFASNNNIKLDIYGWFGGKQCNFTQDTVINVQIQTVVDTALKNMVKTDAVTKFLSDQSNYLKAQAAGIGDLAGIIAVIIILAVGAFLLFGGGSVATVLKLSLIHI